MQRLSHLITSLPIQGVERADWQQFASQVSTLFDADSCVFCLCEIANPERPLALGVGSLDNAQADKVAANLSRQPLVKGLQSTPVGEVIRNGDIETGAVVDIKAWYNQVLPLPNDARILAAKVYRDERHEAVLSVTREKSQADFSEQDDLLFKALIPYIQTVIEDQVNADGPRNSCQGRIAHQSAFDSKGLLAAFSDSLAVIDTQGLLLEANQTFDKLKAAKSLLYLYSGKVHFYDKTIQQWLQRQLSCDGHNGAGKGEREKGPYGQSKSVLKVNVLGQTVVIKLSTLKDRVGSGRTNKCANFLLCIDNFDVKYYFERYKQLFKLTNAEAELAANLALGKTVNQLADEKLLSKHTIRTQLKSVFTKTGTHSQNELIVLLKNVG